MENEKLLEKVIEDRLNSALQLSKAGEEDGRKDFKEAMEAIDRRTKLEELKINQGIELKKVEVDKEDKFWNKVVKGVEVAAIPVLILLINNHATRKFMRDICNFEKDYTFTTTPGRSLSGLFKFRK